MDGGLHWPAHAVPDRDSGDGLPPAQPPSPWLPPPRSPRAPATTSTPTRSAQTRRRPTPTPTPRAPAATATPAPAPAARRRRRPASPAPAATPAPAGPDAAVHGRRRLAARRSAGALLLGAGLALRARLVSPTELTAGPEATERAGAAARRPPAARATSCSSPASSAPGKTTFVRGALRSLGVDGSDHVARRSWSATCTRGATGPLAHLDLYRLAGMGGEDPGLLDPFFGDDTIAFVEWPEHALDALPPERVAHRVRLAHAGGDARRIEIDRERRDRRHRHRHAVHLGRGARRRAGVRSSARDDPGARRAPAPRRDAAAAARAGAGAGRGRLGGRRAHLRRHRPGRLHRPAARDLDRPRARAGPRPAARRRLEPRGARPRRRAGDAGARPAGRRRRPVLAVIDARRGEVFAAAYRHHRTTMEPARVRARRARPTALAARREWGRSPMLAVGDGAVRFRAELERAGVAVPADGSRAHRVSALMVCRLGRAREPVDRDALLPDYRREPDAVPPKPA